MATLYSKCCEEIYATYQYTADDYKKYRDANEDALKEIDYLAFDMTIDDSTVSGEITSTTLWGYDKRFSKAANEEEFKAVIRDYLTNYTYKGKEDAETSIENDIANCLVENATKQEDDTGFFEWAFSGSRKAGDVFTYINEDKTKQTAYFLITPASIDESKTVNVRHILLTADQFGSAEAAKAKAEELLAQWQGGAATAESFGELAKEYSADNSASNGGLIENVKAGAMVENFDAWLFADGRKAGDSGIVETEYGYHVMYMDGEGLVAWEAAVDKTLKDARWAEEQAAVSQKFAVTFNDAVLAAVNG